MCAPPRDSCRSVLGATKPTLPSQSARSSAQNRGVHQPLNVAQLGSGLLDSGRRKGTAAVRRREAKSGLCTHHSQGERICSLHCISVARRPLVHLPVPHGGNRIALSPATARCERGICCGRFATFVTAYSESVMCLATRQNHVSSAAHNMLEQKSSFPGATMLTSGPATTASHSRTSRINSACIVPA